MQDDLISRQAVINIMANTNFWLSVDNWKELMKAIDSIPPVQPEQKTGHWITEDMFDGDVAYRCSECNESFGLECGTPKDNEYNFCPKCGKRLVESQESKEV